MGDLSDLAGRATDADGLTDHLNVEAASLGLTQIASGVLECPGLLFHVGEGRPGRIVVHDWNVDKCDQTKDHEEGPDDVEVRYNFLKMLSLFKIQNCKVLIFQRTKSALW